MSLLNSKQLLEMKQTLELHQTLTSNATTEKGQLHSVDTAYLFLFAALKWLLCQQEEEGYLGSISHSCKLWEKSISTVSSNPSTKKKPYLDVFSKLLIVWKWRGPDYVQPIKWTGSDLSPVVFMWRDMRSPLCDMKTTGEESGIGWNVN